MEGYVGVETKRCLMSRTFALGNREYWKNDGGPFWSNCSEKKWKGFVLHTRRKENIINVQSWAKCENGRQAGLRVLKSKGKK